MPIPLRVMIFSFLAAFISFAPFVPQVMKSGQHWLRQWTMYAGVGTGILKGDFTIEAPGTAAQVEAPLTVLGLRDYHSMRLADYDRYVWDEATLVKAVEPFCAGLPAGTRLSFAGKVGAGRGWKPIVATDLCAPLSPPSDPALSAETASEAPDA